MEELELTEPDVKPEEVISSYRVVRLLLDWKAIPAPGESPEHGLVVVTLESNLGTLLSHEYHGTDATDLMKWMNTANFSTTSMHKRILQKLSSEGVIPGTVTGTPDGLTR